MKKITEINVCHKYAPRISGPINLDKWEISKFTDVESVESYVADTLIKLWEHSNDKSLANFTFPRNELIKYFWSKRPTSFTIHFEDGTVKTHVFKYERYAKYATVHPIYIVNPGCRG